MYYYLIAFQLLCGGFAAFVAASKARSRLLWFFVGALLPVLGVVLALYTTGVLRVQLLRARRKGSGRRRPARGGKLNGRSRSARCRGSYIPDCEGCPYFRRPLFETSCRGPKKGHCSFFGHDLVKESDESSSRVVVED